MYKLPVIETIARTYRFIWAERGAWLNYALGPILLVSLVPTLAFYFFFDAASGALPLPPEPGAGSGDGRPRAGLLVASLAAGVLMLAVYVAFAVAWHRRYLLGPHATSPREMIAWRRRHWLFACRGALLALLAALVTLVVAIPSSLVIGALAVSAGADPENVFAVGLIANVAITLFVAAILVGPALAFPAAAVEDKGFGLREGWRIARGNRWRMVSVLAVGSAIPFLVLQLVVASLLPGIGVAGDPGPDPTTPPSLTITFLAELSGGALSFLGVAVGVTLLSAMYARLRDNVPPERWTPGGF